MLSQNFALPFPTFLFSLLFDQVHLDRNSTLPKKVPNTIFRMKKLVLTLLFCLQILLLVQVQNAWSQENTIEQTDQTEISASQETENKKKELKIQLIELSGIIKLQQKILGDLKSKLEQNPTELTKVTFEGQIPNQSKF